MKTSCFEILGVLNLPGAVMGSQSATLGLRLRVQAPPLDTLVRVRRELAALWPRWLEAEQGSEGPPGDAAWQAACLLGELIIALQLESNLALGRQVRVRPVRAVPGLKPQSFELFLASRAAPADRVALRWAAEALTALFQGGTVARLAATASAVRRELKTFEEEGVNNFFILQAAYALGIPVFRTLPGMLVLGTGARSRWLQSLVSDVTPKLATQVAQHKVLTASLLHAAGLPGSVHQLVRNRDEALKAASELGYPVVVKPADSDRGAGVAADLREPEEVASAFAAALEVSPNVLVERWVPGNTHRLTVQDGNVVRVVRRTAGGVVGDGVHAVGRLVELFQQTPKQQRMAHRLGHPLLTLDEEALALLRQQGLSPQSCPAAGQYVRLRRRDNVNTGGTNEELNPDDPAAVHPDNRRLAIEAARLLRLDFAGIDLITTDIGRSWLDCEALICEVNARPQMGAAHDPGLYQRMLGRLFPAGYRVPAELLVVPADPGLQQRIGERLLAMKPAASVSLAGGLWIEGRRATRSWADSFQAARGLLQRREVSHAVCLMTPGDILRFGLPISTWDRVTVNEKLAFTPAEREQLHKVRDWLEAAVVKA